MLTAISFRLRPLVAVALLLAADASQADDPIKFIGTATAVNKAAATDITNPAKWGDGVSALSADCDYIVDGGKFCGFGGMVSFPGKSLTLGVVDGTVGVLACRTLGTLTLGTLNLNKGTIYNTELSVKTVINGDFVVNATYASPFYISAKGASGSSTTLEGTMSGSGNVCLSKYSSQTKEYTYFKFLCDAQDFSGKLTVGNPSNPTGISYLTPLLVGDVSIGGEISVSPCGTIAACGADSYLGEFTTKKLTFSQGATYRFGVSSTTGSTIRVTEKLTMPTSGKVLLDAVVLPDNTLTRADRRFPLIIAPSGSNLSIDMFDLTTVKSLGGEFLGKLNACSLSVETTAECEKLYLVMDKYTIHNGSADDWAGSSLIPGYTSHWSGMTAGDPIDPNTVYVHWKTQMVTPNDDEYLVFSGKRLVLAGREILAAKSSFTVTNLVIMNAVQFRSWNTSNMHLYGNLLLTNANSGVSATFKSASGYSATIDSFIYGPGGIRLMGSNERTTSGKDDASCTFYLRGINTNLAGRVYVTNIQNSPETNTTLRISDVRQLGGPMASFTYDALALSNWSRLRADASFDFNEPTRGVFFSGGNYVNIPAAANTLTLSTQTTLAGTLVKEGAGTLALGGTLKFTSEQSDTPTAGTNVLQVKAGRVTPKSKTGMDGLEISFASGTGLRLAPLSETDADVVRYGLYDVKWASPFDLTDAGGKLDVALDLPSDRSEMPAKFSFGVCTVDATAAEALDGNVTLPKVRGYGLSVVPVENADGSVTITARYEKPGLSVIIH